MVGDWFLRAATVAMKAQNPEKPSQRGFGEAKWANHPPSGYKAITETIGNTGKVTSVLGGEGVSTGTRMMHYRESRKKAMMPTGPTYSQGNNTVRYMERQDYVRSREVCADCC